MPSLFGTDGVRGAANITLTPELALRIGRAAAHRLVERPVARLGGPGPRRPAPAASRGGRPFIVLGRDSRLSGDLLGAAVTAGCLSVGVDVMDLGILPTPGVAFLARHLGAAGGIVVSASHNPIDDNGIKVFDAGGYKLAPEIEAEIEEKAVARQDRLPRPSGGGVGCRMDGREHVAAYVDHVAGPAGAGLDGLTVVVDAAYGAGAFLATEVLRRTGAVPVPLHDLYDGSRINVDCGSTHPQEMCRRVSREGASAGLALDGDGDRVIACDENGEVVDGDQILAILGLDLLKQRLLPKKTVVATVMSNFGLDLALREAGGRVVRVGVGDRNVIKEMLDSGVVLGGEQSGHIILLRRTTTGDGLVTGIALLSVLRRSGLRLSELARKVVKLPQVLVNVVVRKKDKLETSEKVATAIERVREALGHNGRVLVRSSGTEPLVRVMVEGRDAERVRKMASELAEVVAEELGGEIAQDKSPSGG